MPIYLKLSIFLILYCIYCMLHLETQVEYSSLLYPPLIR